MSTRRRKYGLKSRFTMESLLEATEKVKSKQMTTRQASAAYNIPRTTLVNKLHFKHMKSVGRPCILTSSEESLVQNMFACIQSDLQISPKDVRYMVKDYLDRNNKTVSFLRNNMPSLEWSKMFLDRHEDLKSKIAYERKRKKYATQKLGPDYFYNLERNLKDVLPDNIFNFIELKFYDKCKTNAIVDRKQDLASNQTKSGITVMFCANAVGYMTPPFIIYKGQLKSEEWLLGAATGTQCAVTTDGWSNEETFSDWFHKIAMPLLSTKMGNKILIGDELSCHPSSSVLTECQKHNIKIIKFTSNSDNILQPLEIKFVKTLQNHWMAIINAWKKIVKGQQRNCIPKAIFANLLNKTLRLRKNIYSSKIIMGFKESGIHPINMRIVRDKTTCSRNFFTQNSNAPCLFINVEENKMLEETQNLQLNECDKKVAREASTSGELSESEGEQTEINLNDKNAINQRKGNENDIEYIFEVIDTDAQENNFDSHIVLAEDSFCLINFECSLFPAKVININDEYCELIVMLKYYFGWSLPKNSNSIYRCKIEDIVKVLTYKQVVKKEYGFIIHDDDLQKEWGE